MTSKGLGKATSATIFFLSLVALRFPGAWASVASCGGGSSWNMNSLGQGPCAVVAKLDTLCYGVGSGSFNVPPVSTTETYSPGIKGSSPDCDCNSVIYSLYMECSACQGGQVISWPSWVSQCGGGSRPVAKYPYDIAQGTRIPHWAYIDVSNQPGQIYSSDAARQVGQYPETMPTPGSGQKKKDYTAVVVGSVVGASVPLCIIFIIMIVIRRRKRRAAEAPPLSPMPPNAQDMSEYHTQDMSEYLAQDTSKYNPQDTPDYHPQDMPDYRSQATSGYAKEPPQAHLSPTSVDHSHNPYYNPDDDATFPTSLRSIQSSPSNATTLVPNRGSVGVYAGLPEPMQGSLYPQL